MSDTPKPGDLRVWHVPQIPCPAFHVSVATLGEGAKLCDVLADYDAFQLAERIKPDYSNINGVERWEEDGEGGYDWFDVDDEEVAFAKLSLAGEAPGSYQPAADGEPGAPTREAS